MKKFKFLPSVLMLVLSIAVLGLGVYAANPSTNTVTGSIKVNASAYPIAIRCLLDGEEIENHPTLRAGIEWTKDLSNLEFNTDTALTVEDVDDRVITLEVTNLSNINLGAYFLTNDDTLTAENKATLNSISTVEHLVSGSNTVVKATKTGYQKLEPNVPVEMTVTMSLYQIFYEELDPVGFSFVLNVEECQDNLVSMAEGITVNTNGVSMDKLTITPSVTHGYTVEDGMITQENIGRYSTTNLAIDDDNYINENLSSYKRYRTTNVKIAIYNDEDFGITADIEAVLDEANIKVTTLGNAYIGAKETGEVSLQFTPLREGTETITAKISDVISTINIYRATTETTAQADVYSRIKYNAQGYNGGTMKHYIEYGVNPFKPTEKLKWYVWGVKVGESALRAITDDDMDANNKLIKSTPESTREYYFISEHILDVSEEEIGLMYSNEFGVYQSNVGVENYNPTNYEGSLLQGYLSGTSMRIQNIEIPLYSYYSAFIATGETANFYEFYGLTNDPIFNQINGRSLSELHVSIEDNDFNISFNGMEDKFWALSYSEMELMRGDYDSQGIYQNVNPDQLSGKTRPYWMENYWWTRTPSNSALVWYVYGHGSDDSNSVDSNFIGNRPAFKLEV